MTAGAHQAGRGMTALRRRLAGVTLRTRLIAGLLALFAIAGLSVTAATAAALRPYLIGRLDAQLYATSTAFSARNQQPTPPGPGPAQGPHTTASTPNMPRQAPIGTIGVCFYSGRITRTGLADSYSGHTTPVRLSGADISELRHLTPGHYASVSLSVGDYRMLATRHGSALDITGLSLDSLMATMTRVQVTELIMFGVALLIIGLAGTGWVRLSLRPLSRMTATATEVAELPLANGEVALPHRVPDADPRTEVGKLGAAFNRMLGHVEAALARRHASEARLRTFAADASHELRTPLAAIRGYAELARRHPEPLPGEVAHALSRVESESARMSALVEDLLLLARLDAGRPLESAPVDLARLAIDATSDARAAGPTHRWRLQLPDGPVVVQGDEHRLQEVLANLLSNARMHTPAGTTVTVAAAPGADGAQLSVTDDGPGIPAELQPGLFERFVRGEASRSRAAGGTGLGLSIVAAVVAAHHGTIDVDSHPGHTRITISLPRRPGQHPDAR
jgi:two-component system, OmpR family, sensor kinase